MVYYNKNIVLITSIIDTPPIPLSYTYTRSIYTKEERFNQLQHTIKNVRHKIPNSKIVVVECSNLTQGENDYLINNVDILLNIYDMDKNNTYRQVLIDNIYSISKSAGEGYMTIYALSTLLDRNEMFDNLFKISGRYWLNDQFNYMDYDNNKICIRSDNNISTALYKMPYCYVKEWLDYLKSSGCYFERCVGYEDIYKLFVNNISDKYHDIQPIKMLDVMGISGNIAVDGNLINC